MKKIRLVVAFLTSLFILSSCNNNDANIRIFFDSNGGTPIESLFYDEESTFIMPKNPSKFGYIFDGWYIDNETYNIPFNDTFLSLIGNSKNLVVYAKWKIDSHEEKINVIFKSNNEIVNMYENVIVGSTINMPNVSKEGHTLEGWYTSLNNGETFDEKWKFNEHEVNMSVVLYAKWIINQYTISFDTKGGSFVSDIKQNFDSEITFSSIPFKVGYTFIGWFDEHLNDEFIFDKMPSYDLILYAKWRVNEYSLSIKNYDGTILDMMFFEYQQSLKDYVLPVVSLMKENYHFVGFDSPIPNIMPANNIVITAVYKSNFLYDFDQSGLIIIGYYDESAEIDTLIIPDEIDGMPVSSIGKEAFYLYQQLKDIYIPDSVVNIKSWAFGNMSANIHFTSNSQLSVLEEYAFTPYLGESLHLPNSLTIIKNHAFQSAHIKNLIIPNSVKFIGQSAFHNMLNLNTLSIPFVGSDRKGLISSELKYMFGDGVYSIWDLNITDSNQLGPNSFSNFSNLLNIKLPSSVEFIDPLAFVNLSTKPIVSIDSNNQHYVAEANFGSLIYNKNKTRVVAFINRTLGDYLIIPASVKTIGAWAFSDTEANIVFEEGSLLESIEEFAFYNFSSGLYKGITLPNSIRHIGNYAFSKAKTKYLILPESDIELGNGVFLDSGNFSIYSLMIVKPSLWIEGWYGQNTVYWFDQWLYDENGEPINSYST